MPSTKPNRYAALLEWVFDRYYTEGTTVVPWERADLEEGAAALGMKLPKNLGDIVYAARFRQGLPDSVTAKAPEGKEWVIRGTGHSKYAFSAVRLVRIRPQENLVVTKIPDATPELIRASTLGDEQALLALVRYNRLIDVFLGVAAYSLQNHLRTTAPGIGQTEVDEVYVAVDRYGVQYVLPIQAKGGRDEIGITQVEQDLAVCEAKFPELKVRPIAVQFMDNDQIALFELALSNDEIVIVREQHYQLVPATDITDEDRALYHQSAQGA
ncbi:MAG: transposase [Promicromonosporaceae bacterium]|nr:transposase [Promicromonosporaceae bacterium]